MTEQEVEWLSTVEAARRIGNVHTRTLYEFIKSGSLPAYRFGRVIRLKASDVKDFIDKSVFDLDGADDDA